MNQEMREHLRKELAGRDATMFVKVISVTCESAEAPTGLVDVETLPAAPGALKGCSAVTIRDVPYLRFASGPNGIMDPIVGDLGLTLFRRGECLYLGGLQNASREKNRIIAQKNAEAAAVYKRVMDGGVPPMSGVMAEPTGRVFYVAREVKPPPTAPRAMPARALSHSRQKIGLFTL